MDRRMQGVTDVPVKWSDGEGDLLEVKNYLDGLQKFITSCPTPISIAIQGDWGTGKTSIINYLKKQMDDSSNVMAVYFNTWQYSQFDMSQNLYFSFLTALSQEISGDKLKNLGKRLMGAMMSAGKGLVGAVAHLDKNQVDDIAEKLFEEQNKMVQEVSRFHDRFKEVVQDTLKANKRERLVIFIDDLDRLAPNVAVELLEVMKLFMDVERCVFVLAIDYEVVIQGVRGKYSGDIPLSKCRSFFDKIIQLSFRMPVEYYNLTELVGKHLNGVIDKEYQGTLIRFIEYTIGKNPRSFKRMLNSYLLIQSVYENSGVIKAENDKAMLFCCLCIQTSSEETYTLLLQNDFWTDGGNPTLYGDDFSEDDLLGSLRQLYPQKNRIDADIAAKAKSILRILPQTVKELYGDDEQGMQRLHVLLQQSAITAVGTGTSAKKVAVKVNRIVLDGNEFAVANPTAAITKTYEYYLRSCGERLDKLLPNLAAIQDTSEKGKGIFRQCKEFRVDGRALWIGTSTNFDIKMKQADDLCRILGLASGVIYWYDGNREVYHNK